MVVLCVSMMYNEHMYKVRRFSMKKDELSRVNIFLNPDVKQWFQDEASNMGVSMSALMAMALYQFKEQKEMILKMNSPEWSDMLELAKNEMKKEGRL